MGANPAKKPSSAQKGGIKMTRTIAFVSDDAIPAQTGVGIHIQQLAKNLTQRGYKIIIITTRHKGQPRTENWEGSKVYRVFSVKVAGFYQAFATPAQLKEIFLYEKVELIHHHYIGFLMKVAFNVGQQLQLKQVTTYHFSPEVITQPFFMRPFRSLITNALKRLSNQLFTVLSPSLVLKDKLIANGYLSVRHLPNPITFDQHPNVVARPKNSDFVILYVGRLATEKNLFFLLDAFKKICETGLQATLWLAGDGPLAIKLQERSKELQLNSQVNFLGHLQHKELQALYLGCDVFVLPSLMETLSLVSIEAMHFGKPVIVTNKIISATELVDHEKSGFIIDSTTTDDLVKRLLYLSQNPAIRHQMGQAGKEKSSVYNLEQVMTMLTAIYAEALRA